MKVLRPIGEPVAIGSPKEMLPHIGAMRMYFEDDVWRERVLELIGRARLVVIRTGASQGLRWEIEHIVRRVPPERLLVVVSDSASFAAFRSWTSSIIQWPRTEMRFQKTYGTGIRAFLIFDAHWSPTSIQLRRFALLRRGLFHYVELRSTLKPLLRRFAA